MLRRVVVFAALVAVEAHPPDPLVGEWYLNKSKSPNAPIAAPVAIKIESAGVDIYKFIFTMRSLRGHLSKEEHVRIFDGKPRQVPNDSTIIRTFNRVDSRTLKMTSRQNDGKRSAMHTYTVSTDGKSLSDRYERLNPDGTEFRHTAWYDRK